MVQKKYKPFGQYQFDITADEPAERIFKLLWKKAIHFAVVNAGVSFFQDKGSAASRKSFVAAFDEFPILKKCMHQAWWANTWAGTTLYSHAMLLVFGNKYTDDFDIFFENIDGLYWHGGESWDDLMLFHHDCLLFYVCTHEKFGSIFGNTQLFKELALSSQQLHPAKHDKWIIQGIPVSPQIITELLR
ncbi:hypothetical protein BegalDRAFT_3472 [Beggiatoa alba B18LD]|uniref:Uncharacterized protein n=1 Tax=Beggiatoa alba B18LD TaxID=395493 RepID=I3CKZ3_9GAMM|nr:hypothetical protein [Beggiatoa alba]EIJ44286.1 hypothetical protein BegalDRAFT_3472 [Beggiatoa alba B18LD]